MQGIPPSIRPWAWPEISGANQRKHEHQAGYYALMVRQGEAGSECAHQIDLVSAVSPPPHSPHTLSCSFKTSPTLKRQAPCPYLTSKEELLQSGFALGWREGKGGGEGEM